MIVAYILYPTHQSSINGYYLLDNYADYNLEDWSPIVQ